MNKSGARQKLLEAGMKLFYEKGYYRSGMREIAEFAGVAVTNIFTYFKSKEGFAIAYLLKQEREQAKGLVLLMRQYPNPIDFFQAWFDHLKTKILANEYKGCPFTGFAYQSSELEPQHQKTLYKIQNRTHKILCYYLRRAIKNGHLSQTTDPATLSHRLLILYQGGVASWRLSGDIASIHEFHQMIVEELERNQDNDV